MRKLNRHEGAITWKACALAVSGCTAVALYGCAANEGYRQAFSDQARIAGNSHPVSTDPATTLRDTKGVLVHQGFTVENFDLNAGMIKAVRDFQDADDPTVSYNIAATVDVTGDGGSGSTVTLAASQQTILHRQWHDWWHLLWIIPLFPTGTEYQTVVTREGNVTDTRFYSDFFGGLDKVSAAAAADTGGAAATSSGSGSGTSIVAEHTTAPATPSANQ